MALLLGAGVAAVDFNMLAGSLAPAINITSSVVIGPGKKYPNPDWSNTAMLVPHEPIRHACVCMRWALEKIDPTSLPKAVALKTFYNAFLNPFVHIHHEGEDDLFPNFFPNTFGPGKHHD